MRYLVFIEIMVVGCARTQSAPLVPKVPTTTTSPTAECYVLAYSDPRGDAVEKMFPTWIGLLPGTRAEAGNLPDFLQRDGAAYKQWQQHPLTDSVSVKFTGPYEGVDLEMARVGSNLAGRAIWLTDLVGLPEASMRVVGTRQDCPSQILSAK